MVPAEDIIRQEHHRGTGGSELFALIWKLWLPGQKKVWRHLGGRCHRANGQHMVRSRPQLGYKQDRTINTKEPCDLGGKGWPDRERSDKNRKTRLKDGKLGVSLWDCSQAQRRWTMYSLVFRYHFTEAVWIDCYSYCPLQEGAVLKTVAYPFTMTK